MTFGVTPQGFEKKTLTEILDEIGGEQRSTISPSLNLQADSVLGQLNGVFGDKIRELWDVCEAVYRSQYPDSASGDALDNIAAITGALRLEATNSEVPLYCTGDAATALTIGRIVSVESIATDRFISTAAAVLAAATAWQSSFVYTAGDVVTNNDGTDRIYVCTVGGQSAGATGPQGTGTAIVDNLATWAYVGDGLAFALVPFESEETGPVNAPAFTLNEIETPVTGWSGARNVEDPDPLGTNTETDAAFRARRDALLRVSGAGTIEAIRSDVADVDGVFEAFILENVTGSVDGNGLPGHSFEILARGGLDADIGQSIFDTKPAGIETYRDPGAQGRTVVIEDSQGIDHDINFTRPDEVDIWVRVDVDIIADNYPADGDDQIKAAIVAQGDSLTIGSDVILEALKSVVFDVSGVFDVTDFRQSKTSPAVGTTNIAITVREVAVFDTARVTVNTNPV